MINVPTRPNSQPARPKTNRKSGNNSNSSKSNKITDECPPVKPVYLISSYSTAFLLKTHLPLLQSNLLASHLFRTIQMRVNPFIEIQGVVIRTMQTRNAH